MNKLFNALLVIITISLFGTMAYVWLWVFILANLVEEPLPEGEEALPDLGIVVDE